MTLLVTIGFIVFFGTLFFVWMFTDGDDNNND
jgi:hypothetical protein